MHRSHPLKSSASRPPTEEAPFLYVLAVASLLPSFVGGLFFVFFTGPMGLAGAVLLTVGLISALVCWTAGAVFSTSERPDDRELRPPPGGRRLRS